jgi:hypothetical protein
MILIKDTKEKLQLKENPVLMWCAPRLFFGAFSYPDDGSLT